MEYFPADYKYLEIIRLWKPKEFALTSPNFRNYLVKVWTRRIAQFLIVAFIRVFNMEAIDDVHIADFCAWIFLISKECLNNGCSAYYFPVSYSIVDFLEWFLINRCNRIAVIFFNKIIKLNFSWLNSKYFLTLWYFDFHRYLCSFLLQSWCSALHQASWIDVARRNLLHIELHTFHR